jgi:hypothetical protein
MILPLVAILSEVRGTMEEFVTRSFFNTKQLFS